MTATGIVMPRMRAKLTELDSSGIVPPSTEISEEVTVMPSISLDSPAVPTKLLYSLESSFELD